MFWNNTEVQIIKEIDTADKWWCNSAVLFSVKNGKNSICERVAPEDEEYEYLSRFELNGEALVQGKFPVCPTCKGMLAAGYGIENIDCPELVAARECMNSEFISITDSAEKIKPLLGLLADGYYALADTICFPTAGDGRFFYEVPNDLTLYDAACYGYYNGWDYSCYEHFPLFIYPTQSSSLIDNGRVEYYAEMMRSGKAQPRALAYHIYGFINALLDGHHKACAAASAGKAVNCLTIIPCDGCDFVSDPSKRVSSLKQDDPQIEILRFAGLSTEPHKELHYNDVFKNTDRKDNVSYRKYDLNDAGIHYGPAAFPTLASLAAFLDIIENVEGAFPDTDPEVLSKLSYEDTEKADRHLEAFLQVVAFTDPDIAYELAKTIVKKGDGYMRRRRVRAALLYLLNFRDDETEQLFADFYLNHQENDENMEIANSYWKKDSGN